MNNKIITSPPLSGKENMLADIEALKKAEDQCLLRFFQWDNKTITLGNNEKAERSINLEYVTKSDIQLVRRPTGGRAVFHFSNNSEVTFSLVCPRKNSLFQDNLHDAFHWVSSLVISALPKEERILQHQGKEKQSGNSCFDSLSRYEISYNNHKFFGSAQKRTQSHLLVQSTLLLKGHREFSEVFNNGGEFHGVADIFPEISRELVISAIKKKFQDYMN
ncbi:MAG: hypothetical protein HQK84_03395 [Nitrospinae bacterium]|nr:hypothetical protein [Nitrospinota bacterium]